MRDITVTEQFVFFWGGWPSQMIKSPFVIDGVQYNCCEQFMMAEKARVFGANPGKQQAIGRSVRGFDADVWDSVCRGIVYRGNVAKYEQNPQLGEYLLQTGERTIVEASPLERLR